MWLSWYGKPYRDLVAGSLSGLAEAREGGLFLCMGDLPADPKEFFESPGQ